MNIPDYSNKENYKYLNDYQYFYDKCSACNFHYSDKKYYPNGCLHNICSKCFEKHFSSQKNSYKCYICNKIYYYQDISKKPKDEIIYEKSIYFRKKIYDKYLYKQIENFNNNYNEYNNYLENIENLIEDAINNININNFNEAEEKKQIEYLIEKYFGKEYFNNNNENNNNDIIFQRNKIKNELKKKYEQNDPNLIYSNEFNNIEDENDKMDVEEDGGIVKEYNLKSPKYIPHYKINLIKDFESELKTGGYNKENIYNDLSLYAKNGF